MGDTQPKYGKQDYKKKLFLNVSKDVRRLH